MGSVPGSVCLGRIKSIEHCHAYPEAVEKKESSLQQTKHFFKKKKKIVKTEGIDLVRMQGQHVLCMETVLVRDVVLVQC